MNTRATTVPHSNAVDDRAAVVRALLQTDGTVALYVRIAEQLRDEFTDIKRATLGEIREGE